MPKPSSDYAQYCCELMATVGTCSARRLFGGYGISCEGLTLAIVATRGAGETLWLKAGPDTRALFEAAGCARFSYSARGITKTLGFYEAPVEALESAHEMAPWARLALQAALEVRRPQSKSRLRAG